MEVSTCAKSFEDNRMHNFVTICFMKYWVPTFVAILLATVPHSSAYIYVIKK